MTRWFWAQPRQPCLGLLLCAVGGVLAAERWAPDWRLLSAFLVGGAMLWLRWRATFVFWLLVFAGFALLHHLRGREGAGSQLARLLGPEPRVVRGSGIVLGEPSALEERSSVARSRFTLRLEKLALGDRTLESDARVAVIWLGPPPAYGDRVAFTGEARNAMPARNPGQFDYAGYLRRLGIFSEIRLRYPADGEVLGHGHGRALVELARQSRHWMQRQLTRGIEDSPEIAGLVTTMVLGTKTETPDEIRDLFQRTGTLHVLVVSGLHMSLFALAATFILRTFGVHGRVLALAVIALLAFYTVITGLGPASVRATIMAAVVLGARFFDRHPVLLNSVAAAAFAMLLVDTNQLFMTGFQLSFGVVFTIVLLGGWLQRRLVPLGQPDPFLPRLLWSRLQTARTAAWSHLAGLIAVSTAASVASTPLTFAYFHLFSPSALLANLIIVPLSFLILLEGILSVIAATVAAQAAVLFNNVNWALTYGLLWLVQFFAQLPASSVFVEIPRRHARCEVTVLDLSGGGAVFIRSEGRKWLIDCGSLPSYEHILRPFLRSRGVNRLDGLALTHGDVGHIGAATAVLNELRPREIVDTPLLDRSLNRRNLHRELFTRRIGKSLCARGDTLFFSENVRARVLYPPAGHAVRVSDDRALVLQLEIATAGERVRVLLMADSGFATEQWLLAHEGDLRSDILVKGQHASDFSGTSAFLAAVGPRVVVCSAADFPAAQRVDESWAGAVAASGTSLFRQDQTGAVEIAIERDAAWEARAFLGGQVFTSRAR